MTQPFHRPIHTPTTDLESPPCLGVLLTEACSKYEAGPSTRRDLDLWNLPVKAVAREGRIGLARSDGVGASLKRLDRTTTLACLRRLGRVRWARGRWSSSVWPWVAQVKSSSWGKGGGGVRVSRGEGTPCALTKRVI